MLAAAGLVAAGAVAATAGSVVAAAPAQASSVKVLILSTSVSGGSSSAEAQAVTTVSPGATVTVDTPSEWDALPEGGSTGFASYSAIIIGDPSSGGSCSPSAPSDALSTESTWGPAVTGNVSVLGTAPALAGSAGTTLMDNALQWALAGSATGLYVSLNCDYAGSSVTDADAALLDGVDGGGFDVTGHNSQGPSCSDSGTVNTWEADESGAFAGPGQLGTVGIQLGIGVLGAGDVQHLAVELHPGGLRRGGVPGGVHRVGRDHRAAVRADGHVGAAGTARRARRRQGGAVLAGTASGGRSNPAAGGVDQVSAAAGRRGGPGRLGGWRVRAGEYRGRGLQPVRHGPVDPDVRAGAGFHPHL